MPSWTKLKSMFWISIICWRLVGISKKKRFLSRLRLTLFRRNQRSFQSKNLPLTHARGKTVLKKLKTQNVREARLIFFQAVWIRAPETISSWTVKSKAWIEQLWQSVLVPYDGTSKISNSLSIDSLEGSTFLTAKPSWKGQKHKKWCMDRKYCKDGVLPIMSPDLLVLRSKKLF